jgi:transcriptional regulator with XRE-family HTH domain
MEPGFSDVHDAYMVRRPGTVQKTTPYRPTYMRQWREYRDRTLEEVAEKVGVTHATLSRIERGLHPYSQAILEAVAKELSTDVPSLLTRDPSDPEHIWSIWEQAKPGERQMIVDIAKTIVKPR